MRKEDTTISVKDLIDKNINKSINTRPIYQTKERWDKFKKEKMIETIFKNRATSQIILHAKDNVLETVDGQQRQLAILDYYNNQFPVNEKHFKDLSITDRKVFLDYKIPMCVVEGTEQEIREQFLCCQMGVPLTEQEKRNAHFSPPIQKYVDALMDRAICKKCPIRGSTRTKDNDMAARLLFFSFYGENVKWSNKLCTLMWTKEEWNTDPTIKGKISRLHDICDILEAMMQTESIACLYSYKGLQEVFFLLNNLYAEGNTKQVLKDTFPGFYFYTYQGKALEDMRNEFYAHMDPVNLRKRVNLLTDMFHSPQIKMFP